GLREGLVKDCRAPAARNRDLSGQSARPGRAASGQQGSPHLAVPPGCAHALCASELWGGAGQEGLNRDGAGRSPCDPVGSPTVVWRPHAPSAVLCLANDKIVCSTYKNARTFHKQRVVNTRRLEGGREMEAFPGRNSNLRLCALSGFAALSTLITGFVVAQNAQPPEPSTQLAEVIVTAQYREEKLQDTPIAITALTSDMIEQQGATRLSDILTSAPSVGFRQQSAAFGESVTAFIRGFGQADFDPAFEPGVGLYVDDVYYPRLTGANFDLMDVERVEVLRGPQGTLEGRNSEGGAIRFVTRKPTGDGGGYATVTYGTRDRLDLRAGADIKLADHLFLRLAGTFADQNGFVDV